MFLKVEVYKKSASLTPIFTWSLNKSTTFMCQECSNWKWTNKRDSSTPNENCWHSTYGNFCKCDQALFPFWGGAIGTKLQVTHLWPPHAADQEQEISFVWPKIVPCRRRCPLVRMLDKGGFTVSHTILFSNSVYMYNHVVFFMGRSLI